jgi:hypothetical protein
MIYRIVIEPDHSKRHGHERLWYCGGNTRWSGWRFTPFETRREAEMILAMCVNDDPNNASRMHIVDTPED